VRYVGGGGTDRPIWVYTILPTLISLQLYHLSRSFNSSISVRSHNLFKPLPPRRQQNRYAIIRVCLLALVPIYNLRKLASDPICEKAAREDLPDP
jgi:hypothetical protein